jgi:hypothetical protein
MQRDRNRLARLHRCFVDWTLEYEITHRYDI